ncbi:MAG: hypothetical protein ABDI19_06480 [Armatimonadota bacterium]
MISRWLMIWMAGALLCTPSLAQRAGDVRPTLTITPAPWLPTPQLPPSVLSMVPDFNSSASDFFPAAPTVLVDNTTLTGYYFPVSNITLDDANIPNTLDTDGDNIYYITSIDLAFYVPGTAQQPVQVEVYITTDPTNPGAPVATGSWTLSPGGYILTLTSPRCTPREQSTSQITGTDQNEYDRFWIGMKFPPYCHPIYGPGPGWLLASGPGYEDNLFYWEGDMNCGGNYAATYYWFGGTPRASFYMKVMGAATLQDAIVNPNVTGDTPCVDDADLLAVLFQFGWTGGPGSVPEDTNCDGVVDDADLLIVLFAFGSGC